MSQEIYTGEKMSEEAALKEADIMRGQMGMRPDGSNRGKVEKRGTEGERIFAEPTAEDYEVASQLIDELRKLVSEEPVTEKVLYALARAADKSMRSLELVVVGLGSALSLDTTGEALAITHKQMDEQQAKFLDAAGALKAVEKVGKEYRDRAV